MAMGRLVTARRVSTLMAVAMYQQYQQHGQGSADYYGICLVLQSLNPPTNGYCVQCAQVAVAISDCT